MSKAHQERAAQALKGRTSFVYRGWQVYVYPETLKRPDDSQATCEARPFDQSKCPPDKPNARVAGAKYVEGAQREAQIRMGVLGVLRKVDAIEERLAQEAR